MADQHQGWKEILKYIGAVGQIVLVPIAGFAVSEFKDVARSINQLNVQVAVLLAHSSNQRDEISELKKRVERLEVKGHH